MPRSISGLKADLAAANHEVGSNMAARRHLEEEIKLLREQVKLLKQNEALIPILLMTVRDYQLWSQRGEK